MRNELDVALAKDFQSLYRNRYGDIRTSCMPWGFDIGDGWHGIIRELSAAVTHEASVHAWGGEAKASDRHLECGFFVVADQVKEKFGTLRFYYHSEPKPGVRMEDVDDGYAKETAAAIRGIVSMAEYMSGVTCELCGSPGEINDGGWLSVRCGLCRRADG